ncbi:MAG: methylmalonyl-CoA epimerase [Solirubrobacteraceae bacterium]|jgi:methylmalonyl-CoA/ethylmalonyl-CoA epimerase
MFERIDHVGIAVSELDPALALYHDQFDCELVHRELLDGGAMEAALVRAGDGCLEFVAPLHDDTALARFLARRGQAVHHVAYEVDDIDAAIATLREHDVKMIDEVPRAGIHGSRVAFVHPQSCMGVLTEIVEPAH